MNKYKAEKITVNGVKYDSQLEYKFYRTLELFIKKKQIDHFEFQVPFEIQPAFKLNGKTVRKIEYIADFVIYKGDKRYIVDSKGMVLADFKLKKKMFEFKYQEELHVLKNEVELIDLLDIR